MSNYQAREIKVKFVTKYLVIRSSQYLSQGALSTAQTVVVPQVGGVAVHVEDVEPECLLLVEVIGQVEAPLPLRVPGVPHRLCPAQLGPVRSEAGLEDRGD